MLALEAFIVAGRATFRDTQAAPVNGNEYEAGIFRTDLDPPLTLDRWKINGIYAQ